MVPSDACWANGFTASLRSLLTLSASAKAQNSSQEHRLVWGFFKAKVLFQNHHSFLGHFHPWLKSKHQYFKFNVCI